VCALKGRAVICWSAQWSVRPSPEPCSISAYSEACSSALSTSISPVEVAWLPVSCCQVTVVGRKTVSSSASTAWREWVSASGAPAWSTTGSCPVTRRLPRITWTDAAGGELCSGSSAAREPCGGLPGEVEHRPLADAEGPRRSGDVAELWLAAHHGAVLIAGDLHGDAMTAHLDLGELAGADDPLDAVPPHAEAAGAVHEQGRRRVLRPLPDQGVDRDGGAAVLHRDRHEPGVQSPGLQQLLDDARPQPRIEIVDVRLELEGGGGGGVSVRRQPVPVRAAHQHPHHVGAARGVLGAGADAERLGGHHRLRPGRRREAPQEGDAGGGREL